MSDLPSVPRRHLDPVAEAMHQMFPTASGGADERVIRIPRKTLVNAKAHIPDRM